MAIRLRIVNNYPIALCAVESDPEEGDIYLDDGMHAALSTKFALDFNSMFGESMHYTLPVDPVISELMKTQKIRDAREEFARWDIKTMTIMNDPTKYEYTCRRCRIPQVDKSGHLRAFCPDCVKMETRRLTDEQYMEWLKLARSRIEGWLPLVFWDDETEGNKEMYCSWGMCNSDLTAWPWQDTWKHPRFTKPIGPVGKRQVEHIERLPYHWCPFDRGAETNEGQADRGCFYRCGIFQSDGAAHLPPQNCGILSCINTLDDFKDYLNGLWDKLPWAKRLTETSAKILELWGTTKA